jgi:hypothetical protein
MQRLAPEAEHSSRFIFVDVFEARDFRCRMRTPHDLPTRCIDATAIIFHLHLAEVLFCMDV